MGTTAKAEVCVLRRVLAAAPRGEVCFPSASRRGLVAAGKWTSLVSQIDRGVEPIGAEGGVWSDIAHRYMRTAGACYKRMCAWGGTCVCVWLWDKPLALIHFRALMVELACLYRNFYSFVVRSTRY